MAENDPQVVVINATIYPWQREELVRRQRELGLFSLSETLRSVLNEALRYSSVTMTQQYVSEMADAAKVQRETE